MADQPTKRIGVKFVGSDRPAETLTIDPGTLVRDVLNTLGLGAGFHLVDPHQAEAVFNPSDNLYARVSDGDMLAVSAMVDAGWECAA